MAGSTLLLITLGYYGELLMGKRVPVDICLRITLVSDTADPVTLRFLGIRRSRI